jgi:hypothetical protein
MPTKIERLSSSSESIALTDAAATTALIPYGAVAGGLFVVTALSGATKISWYVAAEPGATPAPLLSDGAAVETAIQSGSAYAVPDACFAARFLAPVLDAGTATVTLSLKG